MTSSDVVVPVDALVAVVDDHLVAFDASTGHGALLNASAALVYTALDGVRPVDAIVGQLADETGMEASALVDDVVETIDRLRAQGIVRLASETNAVAATEPVGDTADETHERSLADDADQREPEAPRAWALDRSDVPIIGATCRVRTDSPQVADLLGPLLPTTPELMRVTEGGDEPASHDLVVRAPDRDHRDFRLWRNGRRVANTDTPESAASRILHEIDLFAIETTRDAVLFHAGAVERNGQVVIVLGISGKGKSTLTAALVQHGFRYVTDEVVALASPDLTVLPYAKAFDLDPASLELLGIGDPDARLGAPKHKVVPQSIGTVSPGGSPALIVFLAEVAEPSASAAEASVERVPPAEALLALMPVTFEQTIANPDHFGLMARLCERTPAIRMGRSDLATMVATIERLLSADDLVAPLDQRT